MTDAASEEILRRWGVTCHGETARKLLVLLNDSEIPDDPHAGAFDMDAIYDNPRFQHLRRKK